jgi:hypothetical protein
MTKSNADAEWTPLEEHGQIETNRLRPIPEPAVHNIAGEKESHPRKQARQNGHQGALSGTHLDAKDDRICSRSTRRRTVSQGAPP